MKIAYRLLVGILTLSVLGCGIFLALGGAIPARPSGWISLGTATLYEDPLDTPDAISLGTATLYD